MNFFFHKWVISERALKSNVHPRLNFYRGNQWESFGIYGKLPFSQKCVSLGVRLW